MVLEAGYLIQLCCLEGPPSERPFDQGHASEGWGGAKLLSAPHTSISYTSILPRPAAAKLELAKLGR